MAVRWLKLMQMLYVCASQNDLRLQNWSAVLSLSTTDLWIGTHLVSKMHQLKQVFALWNCLKEVCFQRFKITGNANSLLNLVETKFYKVGPSLPCLFWFYVPFNLDTPWVITQCLKFVPDPRCIMKILLSWTTITWIPILSEISASDPHPLLQFPVTLPSV